MTAAKKTASERAAAISDLTLKQIAALFDEIASMAVQADRTFFYLGLDEDEERGLKLNSIRALVDRIGWVADLGSHKLPEFGTGPVRGDAERWLLSPMYGALSDDIPSPPDQGDAT